MNSTREKEETTSSKQIESVIATAIRKVGGRKENDLCKYIPMTSGGYMHHFTLKKMKLKHPYELSSLIEKYIIATEKPATVTPKSRAPRGSRKNKGALAFSKQQLERLLNIARLAGDKEMISVLSPRKSLASCKKELIQSIRRGTVDEELWYAYTEAVRSETEST